MKAGIYFLFLAVLLQACGNKGGTLRHKVKFTTTQSNLKSAASVAESYYENLGTYITSITPTHLTAKMNLLMYLDNWDQSNSATHMISYIDGHDNDPNYEISLLVDFSNNQEVSYEPILYGTDLRDGLYEQKEVTLNYFYFVPYHFIQEFEVPEAYGDMNIIGNNGTYSIDSITGKRLITVTYQPLIEPIFGYPDHQPWGYIFGNTDSTFIVNAECADLPASENYPVGGNRPIIRSNKYTPVTVVMPDAGVTTEMYSTISFDTENLIQVYAGIDNIPYTLDDVFVYAPNYWERLALKLELN